MSSSYSPFLALLTAGIEIGLAVWTLRSPGRRDILVPAALMLFLLAGYQLSEVMVCAQPARTGIARLAFADVVWLPPLGIWLIARLASPTQTLLRRLAHLYLSGAAVITFWIASEPAFVASSLCQLVIARYNHGTALYPVYGAFYLTGVGFMLIGATFALARQEDLVLRQHLANVQVGTIFFVVPALIIQTIRPEWAGTSPSMMCHFAIFFSLGLWRLVRRERTLAEAVRVPSGATVPGALAS